MRDAIEQTLNSQELISLFKSPRSRAGEFDGNGRFGPLALNAVYLKRSLNGAGIPYNCTRRSDTRMALSSR